MDIYWKSKCMNLWPKLSSVRKSGAPPGLSSTYFTCLGLDGHQSASHHKGDESGGFSAQAQGKICSATANHCTILSNSCISETSTHIRLNYDPLKIAIAHAPLESGS
ncbi:unnamed protein product [Caretta caretta]